jgi:hypothetical protein
MAPLELAKLTELMERTSGSPEVKIGPIDGPVVTGHSDLSSEHLREIPGSNGAACTRANSAACLHGTFVTGILSARRNSPAPAICPNCTLLIRPIFAETIMGSEQMPRATPRELAMAIIVTVSHVYAIGRIEARFPRLSVEKEFARATGRAETAGQTNQQTFYNVLSKPESRYLPRQLCWVLMIQGLETYIVHPRDPRDFDRLVEAIRPQPSPMDIDVVIGFRGPIAPPELCNGLMVPIVAFDQIYSFDREGLIKAIPRPEKMTGKQFDAAAVEVLDRILQMADNAGAMDDHRALNYLAMRYPSIYAETVEEFARDFSLTGVDVLPSTLSGTRKIVDVIFSYTNRNTDFTEKFSVRVDVTEEFRSW